MAPRERSANRSDELTFYAGLEPFTEFAEVADPARYIAAPDDWIVVLADIKGSTEAARAGRYKDVNLVGAACITAVLNVTRELDLPYAFGGDGATVLIPPGVRGVVADALRRTRRLADTGFGLELRVGLVPVQELRRRGRGVLVAKYQLSPGNNLAMFAGGGLELADSLIKTDPAFTLEEQDDPAPPDLHGLSCRWEPYRSLRGHMLTLLVSPLEADALALQREILRELAAIMAATPGAAGPIRPQNMRFVWPPRGLRAEAIARRGGVPYPLYWLGIWAQSWLQALAERFDLRIGAYDAPAYRAEVQRNSDHRKFTDTLRMVLDCTRCRERRDRELSCGSACARADRVRHAPGGSGDDDLSGVLAPRGPSRALHRRRRWRLRARCPPAQGAAAEAGCGRPGPMKPS